MLHADVAGTTGQKTVYIQFYQTPDDIYVDSRKHGNSCRLKDKSFKNRVFQEHSFVYTRLFLIYAVIDRNRHKKHTKTNNIGGLTQIKFNTFASNQ